MTRFQVSPRKGAFVIITEVKTSTTRIVNRNAKDSDKFIIWFNSIQLNKLLLNNYFMQGTLLGNGITRRPEIKLLSPRTQKSILLKKEYRFYSHNVLALNPGSALQWCMSWGKSLKLSKSLLIPLWNSQSDILYLTCIVAIRFSNKVGKSQCTLAISLSR